MQKKKIAITGGIGSGKSTVCKLLKKMNFPVYSCDEIYKELRTAPFYVQKIEKIFPSAVEEGKINSKKLSDIVFSDSSALKKLNAISHNLVMQELILRMEKTDSNTIFAEVPLLFEGKFENLFDNIIVVLRNKTDRIRSVIERDGLSEKEISARMNNQFSYPENFFDEQNNNTEGKILYLKNDKLSELNYSLCTILRQQNILI